MSQKVNISLQGGSLFSAEQVELLLKRLADVLPDGSPPKPLAPVPGKRTFRKAKRK